MWLSGWQGLSQRVNLGGFDSACVGDLEDVGKGGVAFAPLDHAHVGAIDVGVECESLLGEGAILSRFLTSGTERLWHDAWLGRIPSARRRGVARSV